MGAPPGILAAASPVPAKSRVRANALKAPKPAGSVRWRRSAGPGTKSAAREVWFGSGSGRAHPTHPTLVRTSARARSTDQASRTPRGFADASSIIPSGRSGREDKGAWPSSGEAVLELADAGDRDPHRVAALQELRRGKADADAGRRAGRDEVAGLKRQPGRDRRDERRDVEDEVARVRVLAQLAVDPAFDVEVLRRDLVGGRRSTAPSGRSRRAPCRGTIACGCAAGRAPSRR